MKSEFGLLKYACYSCNVSMSVVSAISPLLFITFRALYGISYSLLGLLVLINFSTQLIIDLIFSFFSHKFNISKVVKSMPYLTLFGLVIYAVWPYVFPESVYIGLTIGTILFSLSAGLAEVLISPIIAEIPADDPDREMSKLHSVYAWGVVAVVIVSTLFLFIFGKENWQILIFIFTIIPLASIVLLSFSSVPKMKTPGKTSNALKLLKNRKIWLCVFAIFLGGASECTMAQWSSGFLEQSFSIPKVWGDIFGVALFSLMLGLGRTLYSKVGKNIEKVLFFGAIGAFLCYLIAAVTSISVVGLFCCAFTGFCTSMLWPGSLIVGSELFSSGGVFIYALMAAGGDLGASVGPQLLGVVTDFAIENPTLVSFAQNVGLHPDQFGMKLGILIAALFPLCAIPVYHHLKKLKIKK